jgi:hypothetical protein
VDCCSAAANTNHAMTEPRPYRPSRTPDEIATELDRRLRAGPPDVVWGGQPADEPTSEPSRAT